MRELLPARADTALADVRRDGDGSAGARVNGWVVEAGDGGTLGDGDDALDWLSDGDLVLPAAAPEPNCDDDAEDDDDPPAATPVLTRRQLSEEGRSLFARAASS